MGFIVQVMVLAVQNAVEHRDLGTATAVETFSRSMGSSFGVAAFGAILNNRLSYHLPRLLPAGALKSIDPRTLVSSPAAIRRLPAAIQNGVIHALARSIHVTFLCAAPMLVVAFVITWFLKESPLRETAHITMPIEPDTSAEAVDAISA
jgi:hypothetical protein